MVSHQLGLRCDIGWREVVQLQSLGLDPSQGFKILEQEVVTRKLRWEFDAVVVPALRDPDDSLDLLHLLVVRRRSTIQVGGYLCTQVCRCDERAKDVLRQNIGERRSVVLDIIVGDVDVLQTQW